MKRSPFIELASINIVVGGKDATEEDEDVANEVQDMLERGQLTATSVPQKYAYGNGKILLYMESGASIEKLEAAYALLAQMYTQEQDSRS